MSNQEETEEKIQGSPEISVVLHRVKCLEAYLSKHHHYSIMVGQDLLENEPLRMLSEENCVQSIDCLIFLHKSLLSSSERTCV